MTWIKDNKRKGTKEMNTKSVHLTQKWEMTIAGKTITILFVKKRRLYDEKKEKA